MADSGEQRAESGQEQHERDYELKKQGLERVLGPMEDVVGHAIIPFAIGGAVDMYYFRYPAGGTAFATMELLDPKGNGPQPSEIGTYELVSFTRHSMHAQSWAGRVNQRFNRSKSSRPAAFDAIERRMCGIFSDLGRYASEAVLNPFETCELPTDGPSICLFFDEYKRPDVDFAVGSRKHVLLLVIEVFPSEMEFAEQKGGLELIKRLKARGVYPYSDMERNPVV